MSLSHFIIVLRGFPGGSEVKNLPANVGDVGLISSWEGPLKEEGGSGNPLQYSCLGNSKDRGALWALSWGHK